MDMQIDDDCTQSGNASEEVDTKKENPNDCTSITFELIGSPNSSKEILPGNSDNETQKSCENEGTHDGGEQSNGANFKDPTEILGHRRPENEEDSDLEVLATSSDSSDDEGSDDDSTSSPDEMEIKSCPRNQKANSGIPQIDFSSLRLRDLTAIDLPPDLRYERAGTYQYSIESDRSILIESWPGSPTLFLGTILFRKDGILLGEVSDILASFNHPCYSVNFMTMEEILEKNLEPGEAIFFAVSNPDLTKLVEEEKVDRYGNDASGIGDKEASDEEVEFSDDEKEAAYNNKKNKNSTTWPLERKVVKAKRRKPQNNRSPLQANPCPPLATHAYPPYMPQPHFQPHPYSGMMHPPPHPSMPTYPPSAFHNMPPAAFYPPPYLPNPPMMHQNILCTQQWPPQPYFRPNQEQGGPPRRNQRFRGGRPPGPGRHSDNWGN